MRPPVATLCGSLEFGLVGYGMQHRETPALVISNAL